METTTQQNISDAREDWSQSKKDLGGIKDRDDLKRRVSSRNQIEDKTRVKLSMSMKQAR